MPENYTHTRRVLFGLIRLPIKIILETILTMYWQLLLLLLIGNYWQLLAIQLVRII